MLEEGPCYLPLTLWFLSLGGEGWCFNSFQSCHLHSSLCLVSLVFRVERAQGYRQSPGFNPRSAKHMQPHSHLVISQGHQFWTEQL